MDQGHRRPVTDCRRTDELFLDLSLYQLEPRFGANGAILEVFDLRLELVDPIFGGTKLTGCLLQRGKDGAAELIHRIAVNTSRFLRCKFEHFFGDVDRASIDGCWLHVPPRMTAQRPR